MSSNDLSSLPNSGDLPDALQEPDAPTVEFSPPDVALTSIAQKAEIETSQSPSTLITSPQALSHQYSNEVATLYSSRLLSSSPSLTTAQSMDGGADVPTASADSIPPVHSSSITVSTTGDIPRLPAYTALHGPYNIDLATDSGIYQFCPYQAVRSDAHDAGRDAEHSSTFNQTDIDNKNHAIADESSKASLFTRLSMYNDISPPPMPPILKTPAHISALSSQLSTQSSNLSTSPSSSKLSTSIQPSAALLSSLSTIYSSQVLLGLVAIIDRPKDDAKQLYSQLMSSGVRFVYMSPQSERHTHAFGVEMGIFTGFNHYISLRAPYLDNRDELFLGSSLLPRGVAAIRAHIDHVDNVPLLVSLLSDSTATTATQMVRVYEEHGETPVVLGSSLSSEFSIAYSLSAAAIAVDPLLPKYCRFHRNHTGLFGAADNLDPRRALDRVVTGGDPSDQCLCGHTDDRNGQHPNNSVVGSGMDVVSTERNTVDAANVQPSVSGGDSVSEKFANPNPGFSLHHSHPHSHTSVVPTFEYAIAAAFTSASASLRLASVFDLTDISCLFAIARSQAEIGKKVLNFLFFSQLTIFLVNFILEVIGAPALFLPSSSILFCFLLVPVLSLGIYVSPREFDAMSLISQKKTNAYHMHLALSRIFKGFLGYSVPIAVVVSVIYFLLIWWLHIPVAIMVPQGSTISVLRHMAPSPEYSSPDSYLSDVSSNSASLTSYPSMPLNQTSSNLSSPFTAQAATVPVVLSIPLSDYYFWQSVPDTHITVTAPDAQPTFDIMQHSPELIAPSHASTSATDSITTDASPTVTAAPAAVQTTVTLPTSLIWHSTEVSSNLAVSRALGLWVIWVYLLLLSLFFTLKRGKDGSRGRKDGGGKIYSINYLELYKYSRFPSSYLLNNLTERAPAWIFSVLFTSLCLLAYTLPAFIDVSIPYMPHASWVIWLTIPIFVLFLVFFAEFGVRLQFQTLEREEMERRDAFLEFDTQLGMHSPVGH